MIGNIYCLLCDGEIVLLTDTKYSIYTKMIQYMAGQLPYDGLQKCVGKTKFQIVNKKLESIDYDVNVIEKFYKTGAIAALNNQSHKPAELGVKAHSAEMHAYDLGRKHANESKSQHFTGYLFK